MADPSVCRVAPEGGSNTEALHEISTSRDSRHHPPTRPSRYHPGGHRRWESSLHPPAPCWDVRPVGVCCSPGVQDIECIGLGPQRWVGRGGTGEMHNIRPVDLPSAPSARAWALPAFADELHSPGPRAAGLDQVHSPGPRASGSRACGPDEVHDAPQPSGFRGGSAGVHE